MQDARVSRIVFALVLIGLGILGLVNGGFAPGWEPVPETLPARGALAILCNFIYLGCGIGLLWGRIRVTAARILFVYLLLWLLLLRVPWLFVSFGVDTWWSASSTAILAGSSWVLYSNLAGGDMYPPTFFAGEKGSRIAKALFGIGLIPIGLAHFVYLDATAPLVPAWMQWPVFWSYFTGAAFVAAGFALIVGVLSRLAAALVTLQLFVLTFVVWTPRIIAGTMSAFQWNEFVVSILLTASAWIVADSFRDQHSASREHHEILLPNP